MTSLRLPAPMSNVHCPSFASVSLSFSFPFSPCPFLARWRTLVLPFSSHLPYDPRPCLIVSLLASPLYCVFLLYCVSLSPSFSSSPPLLVSLNQRTRSASRTSAAPGTACFYVCRGRKEKLTEAEQGKGQKPAVLLDMYTNALH